MVEILIHGRKRKQLYNELLDAFLNWNNHEDSWEEDNYEQFRSTNKETYAYEKEIYISNGFVRIMPLNRIDDLEATMDEDTYLDKYNRLVVSEKTMKVLEKHRINNCDIEQVQE